MVIHIPWKSWLHLFGILWFREELGKSDWSWIRIRTFLTIDDARNSLCQSPNKITTSHEARKSQQTTLYQTKPNHTKSPETKVLHNTSIYIIVGKKVLPLSGTVPNSSQQLGIIFKVQKLIQHLAINNQLSSPQTICHSVSDLGSGSSCPVISDRKPPKSTWALICLEAIDHLPEDSCGVKLWVDFCALTVAKWYNLRLARTMTIWCTPPPPCLPPPPHLPPPAYLKEKTKTKTKQKDQKP